MTADEMLHGKIESKGNIIAVGVGGGGWTRTYDLRIMRRLAVVGATWNQWFSLVPEESPIHRYFRL
jgi:hypothetical protein